jgi:hypothetical protein
MKLYTLKHTVSPSKFLFNALFILTYMSFLLGKVFVGLMIWWYFIIANSSKHLNNSLSASHLILQN